MQLGYVLFYVTDVPATVAFYEAAFGLTRSFIVEGNDYAQMDTGTTALGFVAHSLAGSHGFGYAEATPESHAPSMEIGLVTDDVPAAYAKALAHGAVAVLAPKVKPWGQTVAYVRDMNGFLVELCSPMG